MSERIAPLVKPGHHGTTFGGQPGRVPARPRDALDEIVDGGLLDGDPRDRGVVREEARGTRRSAARARSWTSAGAASCGESSSNRDAADVQRALLTKGFVVGTSRATVLRLLPPYVVPEGRPCPEFVKALEEILGEPPKEKVRVKPKIKKVALAYSGGLDTSDHHSLAQGELRLRGRGRGRRRRPGRGDLRPRREGDEDRRLRVPPRRRDGGVREGLPLPGAQGGCGRTSTITCSARPRRARSSRKKQVEVALATGCDALAHGCTGKGNDQVRFELAYQALAPELAIIAPWREWEIASREDAIDYAAARGIPVPATKKDSYSRDRNLWHLSHEGGPLEEPGFEPEPSMFKLTVDPEKAPDAPERVTIAFDGRAAGGRERPEARARAAHRRSSTRSAAGTASAASTSSRTG